MNAVETHAGGCHCGAVRFQARLDLERPVISCNCSMCGRSGTLLTFIPAADFTLLSGETALTDYQFNKHVIHHLFCKACGVQSFARGKGPDGNEMVAINARCLDGVDVAALKPAPYDGRSR